MREQRFLRQAIQHVQQRADIGHAPGGPGGGLLHGVGSEAEIPAEAGVAHGLHQQVIGGEPAAGTAMDGLHGILALLRKTLGKELTEQRMEAVPRRRIVGLHAVDQQVLVLGALDQVGGFRVFRDSFGQAGIETPEYRQLLHE
ncbi:hypothetical protein D9M72_476180 [compost metagenome]